MNRRLVSLVLMSTLVSVSATTLLFTNERVAASGDYFNSTTRRQVGLETRTCLPEEVVVQNTRSGEVYQFKVSARVCKGNGVAVAFADSDFKSIRFDSDNVDYFVPLYLWGPGTLLYQNSPNTFYIREGNSWGDHAKRKIIRDITKVVRPFMVDGGTTPSYYSLDTHLVPLIEDSSDNYYVYALSRNGNYAVMKADPGERLFLYDLKRGTRHQIAFSNFLFGPTTGYEGEGAVTDDGRYVYIRGWNRIVDTSQCDTEGQCRVSELLADVTGTVAGAMFTPDDKSLLISLRFSNWVYEVTPASAGNDDQSTQSSQLAYLALGDSYSSGEGDTDVNNKTGKKYYREHTDDDGQVLIDGYKNQINPKEKCHISTRSYPYILANGMELGVSSSDMTMPWQSIACSGATAWDVKEHATDNYLGQGDRLKGYNYQNLKAAALNEFIPGRQKQIEFVKKYQPKVITLMMGGNDVDFGGKISECATMPWQCSYADFSWRGKMKNEIAEQFSNLSTLYTELSNATGGKSKIYILGYPVFINGNPYAKCTNILNLDASEREFINNSIIYMNNIIQQAAKKAGVKYIDVESAFGNHRLCDTGSQHVTAITNVFGANANEQQESFHPNHDGHVDMANAVWDAVDRQSLLDYKVCSDASLKVCPDSTVMEDDAAVPPYFTEGVPTDNTAIYYYTLTNGTLVKMIEAYDVRTQTMAFKSESKVDITLYSDPTSLGYATVAADGSVSTQITIPASVPAGYHTLVLSGKSPDGTSIEVYQTVEVRGANPHDIDEDGIDDSVDKCAYLTPANLDIDHDGIDDACDPVVDAAVQGDTGSPIDAPEIKTPLSSSADALLPNLRQSNQADAPLPIGYLSAVNADMSSKAPMDGRLLVKARPTPPISHVESAQSSSTVGLFITWLLIGAFGCVGSIVVVRRISKSRV